MFKLMISC